MNISIEIGFGELIDRISINEVKLICLKEDDKKTKIRKSNKELTKKYDNVILKLEDSKRNEVTHIFTSLGNINFSIWNLVDEQRKFLDRPATEENCLYLANLASKVILANDQRALLKRECDNIVGSIESEQKSFM